MLVDRHGHLLSSSSAGALPRASSSGASLGAQIDLARRSGFRGWFYFPTLDPGEMTPRQTREEVAYKAWWLYDNVDVVRAVIDGLAVEEVDTGIWPKANTSNPHFNRAVNEAFHMECDRPESFDSAEEETFYSAQVLIRRHVRLVGEHFAQLLEPMPDAGAPLPSCHFVNAWGCGNAKTTQDQTKWSDGVFYNRLGKALQFRFATKPDRTSWIDISRENVLHLHDQFWTGQGRGMSGLAPIARKLFRYDEIERAEGSGMLLRTRIAYAITRREADSGEGAALIPGATGQVIDQEDGTKLVVQKIAAGDTTVDVADLPTGFDFKVVESNRAQMTPEWLKWMLYGLGSATGYPSEYVFGIAGITNGTLVRMLQKRVQRVKNSIRNFQLVKQFVPYWYEFWLWQRIKQGRFDAVQGGIPKDFLRHKIIMPADDTVDVGREGKLYDSRVDEGKLSPDKYHGMDGDDVDDVEDEVIAAAIRRARKIKAANEQLAAEGIQISPDLFQATTAAAPPAPIEPTPEPDPANAGI